MHIELQQRGHHVSFELALNETIMLESVELFRPDIMGRYAEQRLTERCGFRI